MKTLFSDLVNSYLPSLWRKSIIPPVNYQMKEIVHLFISVMQCLRMQGGKLGELINRLFEEKMFL